MNYNHITRYRPLRSSNSSYRFYRYEAVTLDEYLEMGRPYDVLYIAKSAEEYNKLRAIIDEACKKECLYIGLVTGLLFIIFFNLLRKYMDEPSGLIWFLLSGFSLVSFIACTCIYFCC